MVKLVSLRFFLCMIAGRPCIKPKFIGLTVANRKLEWLRKQRYSKAQRILPTRLKKHLELRYLPVKTLATSQEVTAKIWKDSTGEKIYISVNTLGSF